MTALQIRTMPLAQLMPAGYNPRKLTAKARRKLAASLDRFGLVEPLVWNERSGRVVGGHARLGILRERGVAEVPVSVVDLSDAEEKALNIVLNNLEAQGRYDPLKLAEILTELEPLPELDATGFDASILRSLAFVPELEPLDAEAVDGVEITLAASRAVYEALAPRLDALLREFDLVSHVRAAPSARAYSATTASAAPLP